MTFPSLTKHYNAAAQSITSQLQKDNTPLLILDLVSVEDWGGEGILGAFNLGEDQELPKGRYSGVHLQTWSI